MIGGHSITGYYPISNYAIIGDCRSGALISLHGSIDWLCWPRFDSPSIFAAILDSQKGGRFRVSPIGEYQPKRRYIPDTNVLETTFVTSTGSIILRDLMPVASEEDKGKELTPEHELLRELRGIEGDVEMEIAYEPAPDYARFNLEIEDCKKLGFRCVIKDASLVLISDIPLQIRADKRGVHGTVRIRAGDRRYFSLLYSLDAPSVIPPLGETARAKVERSISWWQDWSKRCSYQGPYRDMVIRSALVLKLMSYAPSGAIVAAPTTSLPEHIGGVRNWDYRYCWLRDASLTMRGLLFLGYTDEARAFLSWLLHATRLTWPKLQVVYNVFGDAHIPEQELSHLSGYKNSRPLRAGNNAYKQFQLDIYGELIDAVYQHATYHGQGGFDSDTTQMLVGLGNTVCTHWHEPDHGIWEVQFGSFRHTHSNVMCWVALDRLIKLYGAGCLKLSKEDLECFHKNRDEIREEVEARGYNRTLQSYTSTFDGDEVDASLLVLPLFNYIEGTDPRMLSTFDRIKRTLSRDNLYYRYDVRTDDGLPPGEGAFGVCGFWAVECLARGGKMAEAISAFEDLLSYANDVGLYAEEIDPDTGEALGNFPQLFTHVGLINSALTLAEYEKEQAKHRLEEQG